MSLGPQNSAMAGHRKIRILKKLGALALLHKKKYLFAVPFPLPIPIPLLKKTQPIIYKEKIAVPVPVPEPIPVPEPMPEPVHEPHYEEHGYEGY